MKTFIRKQNGFDIYFEALPEHNFDLSYMDEDDSQELIEKLNNYELVCFCAKVTAERNGIELAEDYLGQCIYESEESFYNTKDDYFDDMVDVVIKHANKEIEKLIANQNNDNIPTLMAGGII